MSKEFTINYELVEIVTEERGYQTKLTNYDLKWFIDKNNYTKDLSVEQLVEIIELSNKGEPMTDGQSRVHDDFVDYVRNEVFSNGPTYNDMLDSTVHAEDFEVIIEEIEEEEIEEEPNESDLSDIADDIVDEIKIGIRDSEGNIK
jgi:hypothetical protein